MENENEVEREETKADISEQKEETEGKKEGEEKAEEEMPKEEKKEEQIFVKVANLKPGTILKGKIYTKDGESLFEEYHIFNESDLTGLNEKGIAEIYYVPAIETISDKHKKQGLQFMEQLMKSVKDGKQANVDDASKVVDLLISDVYSQESGIITLLELKDYNEYAYVHSINVGILSIMLAKKMGFKHNDAKKLGLGAFLHDIGKINTPSEMIWKIEGDNDYEKTTISEHPMFGYKILETSGGVSEEIFNIVVGHHENYDGTGYPAGLNDESMDKAVKLVSICNYYDYLVEKAEGKTALSPRDAVLEINNQAGKMFHPKLVKAFINDVSYLLLDTPIYPEGSILLLDTKEFATVETVSRYSDIKPIVRIISNSQGKKLTRPILVNLKNDPTRHISKTIKLGEPKPEPKTKPKAVTTAESASEAEDKPKDDTKAESNEEAKAETQVDTKTQLESPPEA